MGGKADIGTKSFGALLRRYRGRVGLTQEELAARAGLYAQQISQLERDVVRRPHSTTIENLAEALDLDAQDREAFANAARGELSPSARPVEGPGRALPSFISPAEAEAYLSSMPTDIPPDRSALPAGSRMPLAPNPLFVGRGDELLQVTNALRGSGSTVALGQVVASTGLGGLGKTQLAVEFAHRYGHFFAGGVFWLSFASADEIPLQVTACAGSGAIGLEDDVSSRPLEERVKLTMNAWQSPIPRLLVFDNCEEESLLETWRPTSGGCRVLVTSRRLNWSPTLGVTVLPLDLLPRLDSIELLRRYRPDVAPDDSGLDAIATALGDLPLALHLAGSYLRAYRAEVSLDAYVSELRQPDVVRHASLVGAYLGDSVSPTHHVQGVAQTFGMCMGRLDPGHESDRVAIALLARMACMAPGEPVPRDLLARTLEDLGPLARADGLRRLGAVGLVEEEGANWLRLHRLLADFVLQAGPDPGAQAAVDRVLISCGDAARDGFLMGLPLAATIPHLVHAASAARGDGGRMAGLCRSAGLALQSAADLRSARSWLERALAIRMETLGDAHPDTLASVADLGEHFTLAAELATARRLHERALAARERVLGPDHVDTAQSACRVGIVLWMQGELGKARSLLERAVAIMEKTSGPDQLGTATVLNSLALVLKDQGELAAARAVHERALALHTRARGGNHPNTAHSLHNLALVVRAQGDVATARHLHERALAIRERALGPDHLDTAFSLHNLGVLLRDEGEPAMARPYIERALAIRERRLGPQHSETARSLHALAVLLHGIGDLLAAKRLLERALTIREKTLGLDHPQTAFSVNNMALLLWELGETTPARAAFERALDARERILGPDHPETAITLNDLARLLHAQGDPAAARPLFERALAIRERVLGHDHPDTVATRCALARLTSDDSRPPCVP